MILIGQLLVAFLLHAQAWHSPPPPPLPPPPPPPPPPTKSEKMKRRFFFYFFYYKFGFLFPFLFLHRPPLCLLLACVIFYKHDYSSFLATLLQGLSMELTEHVSRRANAEIQNVSFEHQPSSTTLHFLYVLMYFFMM